MRNPKTTPGDRLSNPVRSRSQVPRVTRKPEKDMRPKLYKFIALAAAMSGLTANACILHVRLSCPNDNAPSGVLVCVEGGNCGLTDDLGIATIELGDLGTYKVCVDLTTLPPGTTVSPSCQNIKVVTEAPPVLDFALGGDFCAQPPPEGDCWLTGGGTIGKTKGTPNYSFGGVVYPGCSPNAADGGNWNVIDHATGLHFQGQHFVVDRCFGEETRSPRVNVRVIDFTGNGIIRGLAEEPVDVIFTGRAIDNRESGGGSDLFYLSVTYQGVTVMQIGTSADEPAVISTGNLQIHTSSCHNN